MSPLTRTRSTIAALSMTAVGVAIALSSFAVVRAERGVQPDGSKTFRCVNGYACATGEATSRAQYGLYGVSTTNAGIFGTTTSTGTNSPGVAGEYFLTSGNGYGVYGLSEHGAGVYGISTTGNYSSGNANYAGVLGSSEYNPGVAGFSTTYAGVYGAGPTFGMYAYSDGGIGLVAESAAGGAGLAVIGDDSSVNLFAASDRANDKSCNIDAETDLICDGQIIGGSSMSTRHLNAGGRPVLSYSAQSTVETIEHFGEARIAGGVANVPLAADFASVIDRDGGYYIYLTPLGETRGLYVSIRTTAGFQVREIEHGRSSLVFDYRIVARPRDASGSRLPPAQRSPRLPRSLKSHKIAPKLPLEPKGLQEQIR